MNFISVNTWVDQSLFNISIQVASRHGINFLNHAEPRKWNYVLLVLTYGQRCWKSAVCYVSIHSMCCWLTKPPYFHSWHGRNCNTWLGIVWNCSRWCSISCSNYKTVTRTVAWDRYYCSVKQLFVQLLHTEYLTKCNYSKGVLIILVAFTSRNMVNGNIKWRCLTKLLTMCIVCLCEAACLDSVLGIAILMWEYKM